MHVRALGLASLVALGGCGGAQNNADTAAGGAGKTDDSIGAEAAKSGGIGAAGLDGDTSGPSLASALNLEMIDPASPVKMDGVPGEWPARTPASQTISGDGESVHMNAGLQYDEQKIWVAGEVTDAAFKVGVDHAALVIAFPGPGGALVPYEVSFYAGKPGESVGSVKYGAGAQKGREVAGAKIVEAPAKGGYSFEASIPWSAFPEARLVRVGLRGAVRYVDSDKNVVATGPGDVSSPAELAPLLTEPEQSLVEGLLQPKSLSLTPKTEVYADIAGDAMKERIAVFGHFLTVCGPTYRGGKEFFVRDLAADVLSLEARNATGRDKEDLLLRRRFTRPKAGTRDWFEVWSFVNDEPSTAFAHEIEVAGVGGGKKITNSLHVGDKEIDVAIGSAEGWDATSYKEPIVGDAEPILLPWGPVKEQIFKLQSGKFVKAKEVPNPNAAKVAAAPHESLPQDVPTPPVQKTTPSSSELGKELVALYKKDHGVAPEAKPTADLQVSVAEDPRPERVLVYGRDLVVLGPGFRSGTSYAYLSLTQFSSDADVKEVTARDLTGDGAADILVRGVKQVPQSSGPAAVTDLLFVYQVTQSGITRIFSIETARELGGKRLQGLVQFVPAKSGKGMDVLSSAGKATGFTKENFPWAEQTPGTAAVEPVLLPWGTVKSARYAFDGTKYAYVP